MRGRWYQRVRRRGLSWELAEPTRALRCWWPPHLLSGICPVGHRGEPSVVSVSEQVPGPAIHVLGPDCRPLKARGDHPGRAGEPWDRSCLPVLGTGSGHSRACLPVPLPLSRSSGRKLGQRPGPALFPERPLPTLTPPPTHRSVCLPPSPQTPRGHASDPLTVTSLLCPQTI